MQKIVEPSPRAIEEAAAALRRGRVVAFPTETVYGLAADTFCEAALDAVFALKGRPADNPLIAHVTGAEGPAGARRVVDAWDERADALARRFWPGPLTIVLVRGPAVPARAAAGWPTVAVRAPGHPVARCLLEAFGGPLSAPSANRSGHVSPTNARHVADDFPDADDLIVLDGGTCAVGLESTVVDLTVVPPSVLRPGSVSTGDLAAVLGDVQGPTVAAQAAGPGTTPHHYAPRTPVEIVDAPGLREWLAQRDRPAAVLSFDAAAVPAPHRPIKMPQGAADYAKVLYDALRRADRLGLERILVEEPPSSNELWKAIHDRLGRAAGGRRVSRG